MTSYTAIRKPGSTSNIFLIFIEDSASAGNGKTGLAYNTGSLTAYYKRDAGTAAVSITLVTITTLGTFASGGFKEVDATNMPGVYEFHPPDAALSAGAKSVKILIKGASGMWPVEVNIDLGAPENIVGYAMPEEYGADGATSVSVIQMLNELVASIMERNVSGTTVTFKKRDGSTTAFTAGLDSGSQPTTITRNS
jgi:hypothetical protein